MSTEPLNTFKSEFLAALKEVQESNLKAALVIKSENTLDAIWEKVLSLSVQQLHPFLSQDLCKLACADLCVSVDADSDVKAVLLENMDNIGIVGFLEKGSDKLLKAIHKGLNLQNTSDNAALRKSVMDEILLTSVQAFLQTISKTLLINWGQDLKIDEAVLNSDKEKIIDALMVKLFHLTPLDEVVPPMKKEKKSRVIDDDLDDSEESDDDDEEDESDDLSTKKRKYKKRKHSDGGDGKRPKKKTRTKHVCPPLSNIKKGISRTDLHTLYNHTDLQQFCKEHDLDHHGKKAAVIKRIILYLETGKKPTAGTPKKRGRKKKNRDKEEEEEEEEDDDDE